MSADIVIVGGGQAGSQAAASLREHGYQGTLTIVGDECHLPYQRPPLSIAFLKGEVGEESVTLRPAAFYARSAVDILIGTRVVSISRESRSVALSSGREIPYHHLILATGTRNRMLSVPGADLEGIVYLRSLDEAIRLKSLAEQARRVVIVGAGFRARIRKRHAQLRRGCDGGRSWIAPHEPCAIGRNVRFLSRLPRRGRRQICVQFAGCGLCRRRWAR
jgi:NAD(P)H-nitrite reductase large subunit